MQSQWMTTAALVRIKGYVTTVIKGYVTTVIKGYITTVIKGYIITVIKEQLCTLVLVDTCMVQSKRYTQVWFLYVFCHQALSTGFYQMALGTLIAFEP